MNWQQIFKNYSSNVTNYQNLQRQLHSSYEFTLQPINQQIIVNVWENNNGTFTGLTNYSIQNPNQLQPYRSFTQQTTAQDALDDAVKGIMNYYKPPYNQIKFKLESYY